MRNTAVFISFIFPVFISCAKKHPTLGIVRNIPLYFQNNLLFGENLKSMEEKNAFILATGKIDTTDERRPVEVAFISINNKLMQLDLTGQTLTAEKNSRKYAADGLSLLLSFPVIVDYANGNRSENAHITVSYNGQQSDYTVFIKRGYF